MPVLNPPILPHRQPKGISRWPPILQYVAAGAGLGPNAANGDDTAKSPPARLALSALGGVAWQLRRSLVDMDLLSMQVGRYARVCTMMGQGWCRAYL